MHRLALQVSATATSGTDYCTNLVVGDPTTIVQFIPTSYPSVSWSVDGGFLNQHVTLVQVAAIIPPTAGDTLSSTPAYMICQTNADGRYSHFDDFGLISVSCSGLPSQSIRTCTSWSFTSWQTGQWDTYAEYTTAWTRGLPTEVTVEDYLYTLQGDPLVRAKSTRTAPFPTPSTPILSDDVNWPPIGSTLPTTTGTTSSSISS